MSHVEAFATEIKIESSDQSPFWGPIKLQFDRRPFENQVLKGSEGNDQAIKHTFAHQKPRSQLQTLE